MVLFSSVESGPGPIDSTVFRFSTGAVDPTTYHNNRLMK